MDEATGIIALIGGGFVGLVVLIVVLAKVLSSPRVAGLFPAATEAERIDTSTMTGSAFSDLNSFVPDPSDDSSGSDNGSDSSDSGDSDSGGGSDD